MPKSAWIDRILLGLLVSVLCYFPFYLHGKLNLFELGLYLPGIDAIRHGLVPFRDFFYLRGPFELYPPAWLMDIFGANVAVLATYFYVGTVVTVIIAMWTARELIPQRWLVYVMAAVLVGRTFPRVVFTFWGGMRYAWGWLAVLCLVFFFKQKRAGWLFAAGVFAAIGLWTSVEIGMSVFAAAALVLNLAYFTGNLPVSRRQAVFLFTGGVLLVSTPYVFYLEYNGALVPFFNSVQQVAANMAATFPQTEKVPQNLIEVATAWLNPLDTNFKQMTPLYGYVLMGVYLFIKHRRKKLDAIDLAAAAVAFYGLMLFIGAFRNLWASQFEMALQPWKVVQFFLIAQFLLWLKDIAHPKKKIIIAVAIAAIVASSIGYAIGRYQKRFPVFQYIASSFTGKGMAKLDPLRDQSTRVLMLSRAQGLTVPAQQAEDLEKLTEFFSTHTRFNEPVLMYPEMGAVHFIVDRPGTGLFAQPTMAWISPMWYKDWMRQLKKYPPQYAVVLKKMPDYFEKGYFRVEANRVRFDATMTFINETYQGVSETPSYLIMQRKDTVL